MTAERSLSPPTEPEHARILHEVTELILREATARDDAPGLLSAMCERLVGAGIPLWRVSVGNFGQHNLWIA